MGGRFFRLAAAMVAVVVVLVITSASSAGQTATVEKTRNPPHTPDGQPDLQGWHCQVNVDHGHVGNYLDAEVVRPLPRRST
jgi:hypothetical protein